MTALQALLQIIQMTARQGNDQALGEWVRKFVTTLQLVEENDQKNAGKQILKG